MKMEATSGNRKAGMGRPSHPPLLTPTSRNRGTKLLSPDSSFSLLPLFLTAAIAFAAPIETRTPVKDVVLPTFTAAGPRSMLLRGAEALMTDTTRIDVTDMHLTRFDGTKDEKVDTVFISAFASFYPSRRFVEGDRGVRILHDFAELSGQRWSYDHDKKKVVIESRVRTLFRAQLGNLLK
jgi:hypothetical protein